MAGKHSSLWDHLAWVYLTAPQQQEITRKITGVRKTTGLLALIRAVRLGNWRRLHLKRQLLLALSSLHVPILTALVILMVASPAPRPSTSQRLLPPQFLFPLLGVMIWTVAVELAGAIGARSEHRAMRLCRARTELVRKDRCTPDAAALLDARVVHWWKTLVEDPDRHVRSAYQQRDPVTMLIGFMPMFCGLALPVLSYFNGTWAMSYAMPLMLLMFSGLPISSFLVRRRLRSVRRRLLLAMDKGICPDCGYDLRTVRADDRLGGAVGPSRCVECGTPWPLLPSTVPPREPAENEADKPFWRRDLFRPHAEN